MGLPWRPQCLMPSGYGVDSQNVLTVKVSTFVITDSIFLFSIGVAWMRAAPQPAVGANSRGRADKAMGIGRSAREKVAARRQAPRHNGGEARVSVSTERGRRTVHTEGPRARVKQY